MSPTASTSLGDISIDSNQLLDFAINLEDYSYSFSFSDLETNWITNELIIRSNELATWVELFIGALDTYNHVTFYII